MGVSGTLGPVAGSRFLPRMGFQLIDMDGDPACVTSWLNDDGYIERSVLYLSESPRVEECYKDFLWLQNQIRERRLNAAVIDKLSD